MKLRMVLDAQVLLCVTGSDFLEMGQKMGNGKFTIFAAFLHKSHTWEKSGSWDMGQNALNQSDSSIFKFTKFLEQNDEKAWFVAYWCRFMEIKSLLKNIGVGMVKNGCGHSGLRTLLLKKIQEI